MATRSLHPHPSDSRPLRVRSSPQPRIQHPSKPHLPRSPSRCIQYLANPRVRWIIESTLESYGVPDGEIEDVRQEVLEQTISRVLTLPKITAIDGLVFTITWHTAVNYHRREALRAKYACVSFDSPVEPPPRESPEQPFEHREQIAWADRRLRASQITPRQAHILVRAAEGATHSEIARELGQARSTVRNTLSESRADLRRLWRCHLEESRLIPPPRAQTPPLRPAPSAAHSHAGARSRPPSTAGAPFVQSSLAVRSAARRRSQ